MADPFIGEIRIFPYTYAPDGWALCNGQLLSIQQYPALSAVIGTIYGGDGRTTFAVPDLQSRAPMHAGQGPGLTNRLVGEQDGANAVTLTQANLPSHAHNAQSELEASDTTDPTNNYPGILTTLSTLAYKPSPTATVPMSTAAIAPTGQSQGHENRQPFLTFNFCIALEGEFPPRS
jgi:microcystin-dependent protein